MINKIPNIITVIRLILAFIFVYLFIQGTRNLEALIVFAVAAISDAIDGWLARRLKISSKFGENFDPIADKFLTIAAFVAFALQGIVEYWCVAIIILRDVSTTVLRYCFFSENKIPTSKTAKFKTVSQFTFIIMILLLKVFSEDGENSEINAILHSDLVYYSMLVVTLLTVWTMFEYIFQLFKAKKNKDE